MDDYYKLQRKRLIEELKIESIHDPRVLNAINNTRRELFVPDYLQEIAYANKVLPIYQNQTISQPYVVAKMTEIIIANNQTNKVLEIGTGSGYQAAILANIYQQVYSIERIEALLTKAKKVFQQLTLDNIHTLYSDGNLGWAEHAPYDAIIVTAAAQHIPPALTEQLAEGGRLMIPLQTGSYSQQLTLIEKINHKLVATEYDYVVFVPLRPGKQ